MIQLPSVSLPDDTAAKLCGYQAEVNAKPTYALCVAEAKKLFPQRNRRNNAAFSVVRSKLDEMCSGPRRCCYCEDSCADEVEHVRPKDLYPDHVFRWENYAYACGPCNGRKRNQFAVFEAVSGEFVDVTRNRNDPVEPPTAGKGVLIDPRQENPLQYIGLELVSTFYFVPVVDGSEQDHKRAEYTIKVLGLNRDILPATRKSAFGSYCARLKVYHSRKTEGANPNELERLAEDIRSMHHPTVWQEMKRQHRDHDALRGLFANVPEALDW